MSDIVRPAGLEHGSTAANGIEIHYEAIGSGPLVVFCHGWPESWYSWRHQLPAIADAGFRAVALHMRGYGDTTAPNDIDKYMITDLIGDVVAAVQALGADEAASACLRAAPLPAGRGRPDPPCCLDSADSRLQYSHGARERCPDPQRARQLGDSAGFRSIAEVPPERGVSHVLADQVA